MPIVGMTINSVTGNKKEKAAGTLNILNKTNLLEVNETKLEGLGKNGVTVKYEFITQYEDSNKNIVATISYTGNVLVADENAAALAAGWTKDKKLPEKLNLDIINLILRRCFTRALVMSEDLQLPPAINMPFAKKD